MKNKSKNKIDNKKIKKARLESLGTEAWSIILVNLLCVIILTPLYQLLGSLASGMAVDVEMKGGFLHILCDVGANVLFYLASFLGTAVFFVGAFFVIRAVYQKRTKRALGASAILYVGMSVSSVITVLTYLVIKLTDPSSITLSNPEALAIDVLFLLLRVILILVCALICRRVGASVGVCAIASCITMFMCAVGLELYDNIPFFLKGIILDVDVINMVISMILYAIHACLGYIVVTFLNKKANK